MELIGRGRFRDMDRDRDSDNNTAREGSYCIFTYVHAIFGILSILNLRHLL